MKLADQLQLYKMEKEQLVELCNALYELLNQRQAFAPAYNFIPQPLPLPSIPQPWCPTYDLPKITYTNEFIKTQQSN